MKEAINCTIGLFILTLLFFDTCVFIPPMGEFVPKPSPVIKHIPKIMTVIFEGEHYPYGT